MSDTYGSQRAREYGDTRVHEQTTQLDLSGDFLRQAQQAMEDTGTERHGSLEPDDSRNVTGAGGAIRQPGGADQQQGGERWGGEQSAQQSQALPEGVPQQGQPFTAQEAAGQSQGQGQQSQQQDQSAGTEQVQFDAEGAGAGQEVEFDADASLENQAQQSGTPGQQTQFDPGQGQQGGGERFGSSGDAASQIREHMEVIGADGVHLGTVDGIEGGRIKLTKGDSASGHQDHHHYISCGLVAGVEGDKVRLSATAANAYGMEEEE